MITARVTFLYHRDSAAGKLRGEKVERTIRFENFDAAEAFGHELNSAYRVLNFHCTNVWIDGGSWTCFDISEIWDAAEEERPGFIEEYNIHNPR